jgi:hypothetical protein
MSLCALYLRALRTLATAHVVHTLLPYPPHVTHGLLRMFAVLLPAGPACRVARVGGSCLPCCGSFLPWARCLPCGDVGLVRACSCSCRAGPQPRSCTAITWTTFTFVSGDSAYGAVFNHTSSAYITTTVTTTTATVTTKVTACSNSDYYYYHCNYYTPHNHYCSQAVIRTPHNS